ncbi:hypothetical protein CJ469_05523 [Nocardia farcinica]|nr:hypothetical protein CJ469_05523 [Nocardia farcinica]PFX06760.1 hypothetical protein CJ468_04357 [Nocardia farcinica]
MRHRRDRIRAGARGVRVGYRGGRLRDRRRCGANGGRWGRPRRSPGDGRAVGARGGPARRGRPVGGRSGGPVGPPAGGLIRPPDSGRVDTCDGGAIGSPDGPAGMRPAGRSGGARGMAERAGGTGGGPAAGIVHADAEFGDQSGQAAAPALADGAEPPGTVAPVELAEHQRCHRIRRVEPEPEHGALGGEHGDREPADIGEAAPVETAADHDARDVGLGARQRDAQPRGARRGLLIQRHRLRNMPWRVVEHQITVGAHAS